MLLKKLIKATLVYKLLVVSTLCHANWQLDSNHNYPGGIATIKLEKNLTKIPEVHFGTEEVTIIDNLDHWLALIGIDLDTLPGEYLVYVNTHDEKQATQFKKITIHQKHYPLSNSLHQQPDKTANRNQLSKLSFINSQQPLLPLHYPIAGQWINTFGIVNLAHKGARHHCLSFETKDQQQQIITPSEAIVSNIEVINQELKNHRLYLDHGRGLFSVITGVTELKAKIGDTLKSKTIIGKTLPNSETTWQTLLNNTAVNPILLLSNEQTLN